jgi:hypothetical protein
VEVVIQKAMSLMKSLEPVCFCQGAGAMVDGCRGGGGGRSSGTEQQTERTRSLKALAAAYKDLRLRCCYKLQAPNTAQDVL